MLTLDSKPSMESKKAVRASFPDEPDTEDMEELKTRIQSCTGELSQLITSGGSLVLRSAEKAGILGPNEGNPFVHMDVMGLGYYGTKVEKMLAGLLVELLAEDTNALPPPQSGVTLPIWADLVLVPELINIFIMQDKGLSYQKAHETRLDTTSIEEFGANC
ncbi:hypothetical protein L211DRAFT_853732 [Terfezia boudieri ATCC MYA-4762]|uniref:Restriction of telomere capping protein 4 C-terminal domain-containing protein n=1 Tax=Terfezia boudieri ATCC MYA-4762 TaxID=1051890 RepID=A0A3N4LLR2_9PEZI|nr:hypothetical protein L211DRAFT_853732 [Terfezia boudieri ATCC MYA-4762]